MSADSITSFGFESIPVRVHQPRTFDAVDVKRLFVDNVVLGPDSVQ